MCRDSTGGQCASPRVEVPFYALLMFLPKHSHCILKSLNTNGKEREREQTLINGLVGAGERIKELGHPNPHLKSRQSHIQACNPTTTGSLLGLVDWQPS